MTGEVIPGPVQDEVKLRFKKFGHEGVQIQCRVNGGAWLNLSADTQSPTIDNRPLADPGQPEMREYRACFWDDGALNGGYCDTIKLTVGPS